MCGLVLRQAAVVLTLVTSLAAQEQVVAWATYLGGPGDDRIHRVTVAANGDLLIAGNTTSGTLAGVTPTLLGADDPTRSSQAGGFVARLSPDGQTLRWVRRFGRGVVFLTDVREVGAQIYVTGVSTAFGQSALIDPFSGYDRNPPLSVKSEYTSAVTTHAAPFTYRSILLQLNSDASAIVNGTWLGEPTPGRESYGIGDIIGEWYAASDMWRYLRQRDNWAFSLMNPYTLNRIEPLANGDLLLLMDGGLRWAGGQDVLYRFASGDISAAGLLWKTVFNGIGNNSTVSSPEHSSMMSADLALTPDEQFVYVTGGSNGWTGAEPYWNPYVFKFDPATGQQLWDRDGVAIGGPRGAFDIVMTSVRPLISDSFGQALVINANNEPLLSMWTDGGATFLMRHPWTLTANANAQDGDGFWGMRGRTFASVLGRMAPDGVSGWRRSHRIKPNPDTQPEQNATLFYAIAAVPGAPTEAYAVGFSRGLAQINPLSPAGDGFGVILKLDLADGGTTRRLVERLSGVTELLTIARSAGSKTYTAGGYGTSGASTVAALQPTAAGGRDGFLIQFHDTPPVIVVGDGTADLAVVLSGDQLAISFRNTRLGTYTLEVTSDLGGDPVWTPVPDQSASPATVGEQVNFTVTPNGAQQFYRLISAP